MHPDVSGEELRRRRRDGCTRALRRRRRSVRFGSLDVRRRRVRRLQRDFLRRRLLRRPWVRDARANGLRVRHRQERRGVRLVSVDDWRHRDMRVQSMRRLLRSGLPRVREHLRRRHEPRDLWDVVHALLLCQRSGDLHERWIVRDRQLRIRMGRLQRSEQRRLRSARGGGSHAVRGVVHGLLGRQRYARVQRRSVHGRLVHGVLRRLRRHRRKRVRDQSPRQHRELRRVRP